MVDILYIGTNWEIQYFSIIQSFIYTTFFFRKKKLPARKGATLAFFNFSKAYG